MVSSHNYFTCPLFEFFSALLSPFRRFVYHAMSSVITRSPATCEEIWAAWPDKPPCPPGLRDRLRKYGLWTPCQLRFHRRQPSSCTPTCGCSSTPSTGPICYLRPCREKPAGRRIQQRKNCVDPGEHLFIVRRFAIAVFTLTLTIYINILPLPNGFKRSWVHPRVMGQVVDRFTGRCVLLIS